MSCVLYESQDGIARITLNRPEARNAINTEVVTELQLAWQRFATEDDRVAVLSAAGDLAFIVVGDRAAIEPQLKALGLPVEYRSLP